MDRHIALLGDSIFDNARYTNGRPDVVTHLRQLLPGGMAASLLAVDGTTTAGLKNQVARLTPEVTDVVVSIGGNDALGQADAMDMPIASTAEALRLFGQRAALFEANYRTAIDHVRRRVPSTTVCTIYNANLPGDEGVIAPVGLTFFNDVILRTAFEWHLPVIDLRFVCVEPADYANPIEPSSIGAAKIATAIAGALGLAPEPPGRTIVFAD